MSRKTLPAQTVGKPKGETHIVVDFEMVKSMCANCICAFILKGASGKSACGLYMLVYFHVVFAGVTGSPGDPDGHSVGVGT